MKKQPSLDELIEITKEILRAKYPSAEFAFLSGSIIRGEGTPFSDLDIVVIFKKLPNSFRESFYFQDLPIETFVHTPETLNYFFESDARRGVPSLAAMVAEGIEVPHKSDLSEKLKRLANEVLKNPPNLTAEQTTNLRYHITNLVDDIRAPRSKEELTASATELYAVLAEFYLRANGFWAARNKSIPRMLRKTNPEFGVVFGESFEELFVCGKPEKVIQMAETVLEKSGGFASENLRFDASADWQKPIE
ncbi:MAG: nucleotidyltransferase domain-containing protein [Pyrinomonadaceae bacterium]